MNAEREERLASLLAIALEQLEQGASLDLEHLCSNDPTLMAEVAELMSMSVGMERMHRAIHTTDSMAGRILASRYRLIERIGSGAAGSVYRAFDEVLARDVAVKILHGGSLGGGAAEDRFLREAEVLAKHERETIVRVYDRGRTDRGELFLVTELLTGVGLADVLDRSRREMPHGPSPGAFARTAWLRDVLPHGSFEASYLRQLVTWMLQLCDGLAHAHTNGVFHRDVKPSNVFLRQDGRAVLLDFGIAARIGDPALTMQTSVLGTPWYMPPEQARGKVAPAPTLDVYGVCATLYHLCTLRAPHGLPDAEASIAEVLEAARNRDPLAASELHPGLPRDLAAILDHGLEADPARRYATIAELADDLRAFLEHRPVDVRPIGRLGRAWRRARRSPARTIAIVAVVCALVLAGVVWPLADSVSKTARAAEFATRIARLPGDLSIEGWPDQRLLVPLAEREQVMADLDRLLEIDPTDCSLLLLRASEALDAGDHASASQHLRAIATSTDDPYLRAVAERYDQSENSQAGIAAVNLAELPHPTTVAGEFVAGFHALRVRDIDTALAHLDQAEQFIPARDLRLLALLGSRQWERAASEANWLEGHYGRPTARTRHALAAAAIGRRRYAESVAFAEASLELRPDRHGPWNNLGYAKLRVGRAEEARTCFERAVAIRPWFDNSRAGLCQTLRTLEEFELAESQARAIGAAWWREWELGNVSLARALAHRRGGASADSSREAERAITHFRLVAEDDDPTNQKQRAADGAIAFAKDLCSDPTTDGGDSTSATIGLLLAMRSEPLNPAQLLNLCDLLGSTSLDRDSLGLDLLDAWQLWLCEVGTEIAPEDIRWKALRTTIRDRIENRPR